MLKQTRFYLGIVLIVQAISCFFLTICYLFKDKKNTAGPFTLLGLITAVGGIVLISEKIKERFDDDSILEAMNDICDVRASVDHLIPIDDTADEAEFN